jgi:hypothetical protein
MNKLYQKREREKSHDDVDILFGDKITGHDPKVIPCTKVFSDTK